MPAKKQSALHGLPTHAPRIAEGKIALADVPLLCTVAEFPDVCQRLRLFAKVPHRSTVARWVANGKLATLEHAGVVYVRVHNFLKAAGLAF